MNRLSIKTKPIILQAGLYAASAVALTFTAGRIASRRALIPVKELTALINEIREDRDVSKRVPASETHDETGELTEAINGVIDTIEGMIEREKQFVSDVSHELRTPLTIISTQSEYALEDPGYAEQALKTINRESRHMSKLINDLLMISRSDSGRLQPEIRNIDIREVLSDLAMQSSIAGADNDISVEFIDETQIGARYGTERKELIIESDEALLMRILLNLLDNAGKYGKVPGGRIEIRLRIDHGNAVITVADDGNGVAAEDQSRIWSRFYRTKESRGRSDSSGLGLAMVDSLTRALGGSIRIVPNEDKRAGELPGAVFEIKIPIRAQKTISAPKN